VEVFAPGSHDAVVESLRTSSAQIYETTKFLLVNPEGCTNDSDRESDSNSDSDSDVSGYDQAQGGLSRLIDDVKTHMDCLMDLSQALENPAVDPEYDDEPSILKVEQRYVKSMYTFHHSVWGASHMFWSTHTIRKFESAPGLLMTSVNGLVLILLSPPVSPTIIMPIWYWPSSPKRTLT
jgi:hypothetical protein